MKNIIVIVLCVLVSCSDKISQRETDIKKYIYLEPFAPKNQSFKCGILDIDNNHLEYSYKVSNPKKVMYEIYDRALSNNWVFKKNTYTKCVDLYGQGCEKIKVKIIENGNNLKFIVTQEYE